MIVEDDAKRRRDLYEILKLTRVDVLSAKNNQAAMEMVRREHPELILLNMFSHETDGISFLTTLRSFGMGRKIIVLGMVGDEEETAHRSASIAGPDKLLDRDPAPHLVLELVLGFLEIEQIEVPTNLQAAVGSEIVEAVSTNALEKEPDGELKPIIKDLSGLLRLTDDAGL
jgi:CheY-like chemotaxis protein